MQRKIHHQMLYPLHSKLILATHLAATTKSKSNEEFLRDVVRAPFLTMHSQWFSTFFFFLHITDSSYHLQRPHELCSLRKETESKGMITLDKNPSKKASNCTAILSSFTDTEEIKTNKISHALVSYHSANTSHSLWNFQFSVINNGRLNTQTHCLSLLSDLPVPQFEVHS